MLPGVAGDRDTDDPGHPHDVERDVHGLIKSGHPQWDVHGDDLLADVNMVLEKEGKGTE